MPAILFEVKENIACITLNRPEVFNAFNREMALQLQQHLDDCRPDSIRCVYISGAGKAFSAGQDLAEISAGGFDDLPFILKEHFNPIVRRIRRLEKPVVAAVNGVAAGAGANIALCCDVVVAAQSARFIQAFSKVGLIPDSGGTYFLPRLVGFQKAMALAMLGDAVPAEEAERMGMIYKFFADADFETQSFSVAQTLAQLPTKSLALTKKAFENSLVNSYDNQLHDEELLQSRAGRTEDFKEGVAAFLEKRAPVFKGI